MAEVTLSQLASDIDTSVDRLVQQFREAGMEKSLGDSVSETEKADLLTFLKKQHGGAADEPKRMTLQRKTMSTLNVPVVGGKSKEVQVEVRKKRTYVRRDTAEELQRQQETEEQARLETETQAKQQAEEQAKRDAEATAKREAQEKAKRDAEEKARQLSRKLRAPKSRGK